MSIEKQDNWRWKLLDLDNLPGDTAYDKDTAWHQLQSRLQPSTGRKKGYWYWAAAAAALIVFFGWPLLTKKTAAPAPISSMARQQVKKAASPVQPIKKESPGFIIVSAPFTKKSTIHKASKYPVQTIARTADSTFAVLMDSNNPPTAIKAAVPSDSTLLTAAVAPNKKIPVLHINELATVAPQLALSPAPLPSRWRIKRPNRTHANQLLAAQKGYDGIINIKLSSKN